MDVGQSGSPLIELTAVEPRRLLDGVGRDLADFLAPAVGWVRLHLPGHAEHVIDALARALAVLANGGTQPTS